jgi:hypothetical protein
MRKVVIQQEAPQKVPGTVQWLDLERLARVEITSEDPNHPVESALVPGSDGFWKAAQPGGQKIRLFFDEPQRVRRIHLTFFEKELQRTQEFSLKWLPEGEESWRELLRQQFTFSSPGTTSESEDYAFNLDRVTALELDIVPNISGGEDRASLAALRVA